MPYDSAAAAAFVSRHSGAIRLGSFLELLSAFPLALFMAVTVSRLRVLGTRHAGEQIAALGAIITPLLLVGTALATWSLTRPGVAAAPGAPSVLQALAFDGGGPAFAVFLGLFVAGVSVVGRTAGAIPRWLVGLGIAVATAGELSAFTLLNFTAGYFIPAARFLSIVWMLGLAVQLPPPDSEGGGNNRPIAPSTI